jgi:endonuclease III
MVQESDPVWLNHFRKTIITYNENRAPDPFMIWFRKKDAEGFFEGDFERVLTILIDARFDQRTTAENALENTVEVVKRGALKKLLATSDVPSLIPRQNVTAEQWADLFCSSLSKLRALSTRIVTQKDWDAAQLLESMRNEFRVPYLGTKTARLAVRWLHELVPGTKIDMSTYKIPIDTLVYRVWCRLGIIDPNIDKYSGENSPADLKIQAFVAKVSPEKPWLLDEPLWSTGRQPNRGGHCYPTNPNCVGCLFEGICQKGSLDADPSLLGMDLSTTERQPKSLPKKTDITGKQAEFAKFVEALKQKGITGEEYREKVKQWQREHQDGDRSS